MNKILIERRTLAASARLGDFRLLLDDKEVFKCYELANKSLTKERGDDGALSAGRYKCGLRISPKFSPSFSKFMSNEAKKYPAIVLYNDKVPYDRYILIHHGNTDKDTAGCELIGYEKGSNAIGGSRNATRDFYALIYEKFGTDEAREIDLICEIIDELDGENTAGEFIAQNADESAQI